MASADEQRRAAEKLRQEARKAEAMAKNERDRKHAQIADRLAREAAEKANRKN